MYKNSNIRELTEIQIFSYVLRCITERKSEEQIAERLDRDIILVKTLIDALKHIDLVSTNYFDELVITPDEKITLKYLSQIDKSVV
jgi:gamma-glutamyl phosphate reductase